MFADKILQYRPPTVYELKISLSEYNISHTYILKNTSISLGLYELIDYFITLHLDYTLTVLVVIRRNVRPFTHLDLPKLYMARRKS